MSGPSKPAASDALFKVPLAEFTAARNALVAQLKKDGRQAEASEVKALAKPSVSAWVVNQLYWRHRELFDRLIEAGDRLRRAHAAQRSGDSARDRVNARREVVAQLASSAADLLREANHGGTRDLMRRVTSTLEALSSYGSLPGAPAAGRLVDDVEPAGFEAVLGVLPAGAKSAAGAQIQTRVPRTEPPTKRPSRAREAGAAARRAEDDRKRLVAASKAAVRTAERALNAARKEAARAATALEAAATRAKTIDAERAQAERRLARIARDAEAAQAEAREAATNAARATQAAHDAERALELARDGLANTVGSRD